MNRMKILKVIYIVFALLLLGDLFFRNLFPLLTTLNITANELGISISAQRIRLITLTLLDLVAAVGAIICAMGLQRVSTTQVRLGSLLVFLGLAGYGAYQIVSALFQLNEQYTMRLTVLGSFYFLIGFFNLFAARLVAPRSLL